MTTDNKIAPAKFTSFKVFDITMLVPYTVYSGARFHVDVSHAHVLLIYITNILAVCFYLFIFVHKY
ncbi:MAG: hypothetical protein ABIT08_16135 [Bacteroidia bacterium]